MNPNVKSLLGLPPLTLERVVPMHDASELTSLSIDTLERRFPHLIVRLSPRRKGMKLKNILAISEGQAPAA